MEIVSITLQEILKLQNRRYQDALHKQPFVSTPIREAVNSGRADYIPVFLSDILNCLKEIYFHWM